MSERHRRRHGMLFWRVYRHGLLLVVLVGLTSFGLGWLLRPDRPWVDLHERMARYVGAHLTAARTDPAALSAELARVEDVLGLEMTLYGPEGTPVASNVSPPLEAPRGWLRHRGERPPPGPGGGGPRALRSWHRQRQLYLAAPLDDGGLAVARSPGFAPPPVPMQLSILLACLGVLALGSWPLARGIVRPLERLTETARALGRGDLSVRSGLCAAGEVGTLAQAFDEMAERIQRQMAAEKALLANVSHELRTPLSRIRVALELALPDAEPGPDRPEPRYLREIAADLEELDRLLGDLLTTVRLDAAPPLNRELVPGAALIERAEQRFRGLFPERALRVELPAPPAALPRVHADPVMVRRIIDNLLDNARKYSDGPIVLSARAVPATGALEVAVRDDGIGLSPEEQASLFTPFYRTDASRARSSGGVGLGLALARRIVEAHGGTIEVESSPGAGSTFRFRLPAASDAV